MNKQEKEKKLTMLMDLVTSLETNGYREEAEELQEYLLNPEMDVEEILGIFGNQLQDIYDKRAEENEWKDCFRDDEWNQYETAAKGIERIMNVEVSYTKYKDIVKYDDVYLFYDNVLDRWMVRGHQRLWLSNIEKDNWTNGFVPQEYIERWKWVVEKIIRMPRVEEFTLRKYDEMLKKWWIDIEWNEVISNTIKHQINCWLTKETIERIIDEEIEYFESDDDSYLYRRTKKDNNNKEEVKDNKTEVSEFMKKQLKSLWIAVE